MQIIDKTSCRELAFCAGLLAFCITVFLTQEINPFPDDWWFESHLTFLFGPAEDDFNYTPVALPAFLYAAIHVPLRLMGMGMQQEMVAGALAHHVLFAVTGWLSYRAHRLAGFGFWVGAASSFFLTLFVESTLMAQSFWSENMMLPLVTAIIWLTLRISIGAKLTGRAARNAAAGLGLLLGLAVITRAIPIVLLPAVLLFFRAIRRQNDRRIAASVVVMACSAVILLQMTANWARYERFELSHSTGLHLWNAVSSDADVLLAEEPLYRRIEAKAPDVGKLWWWQVSDAAGLEMTNEALEDALRPVVLRGISRHPLVFLRSGVTDFAAALPRSPLQLGYRRASYYNPLNRDAMLPAPGIESETLLSFLSDTHRAMRIVYAGAAPSALFAGLLFLVAGSRSAIRLERHDLHLWLLCAYSFAAPIYLSNQIERFDLRYAFPYLGVLALLICLSGRLTKEVAAQALRGRSRS